MNMNPSTVYHRLLAVEADGRNAADCRRVIRDERQRLHTAIANRSQTLPATAAEAQRVLDLWAEYIH